MGSIAIHELDEGLSIRLAEEARRVKKSKNQLVKELLSRSLGLRTGNAFADGYWEFCGLWSQDEHEAFQAAQADNSRIDVGDWS